jgi:hypothetical protein
MSAFDKLLEVACSNRRRRSEAAAQLKMVCTELPQYAHYVALCESGASYADINKSLSDLVSAGEAAMSKAREASYRERGEQARREWQDSAEDRLLDRLAHRK